VFDLETTAGIELDRVEVGIGFWRVSEGVLDRERDEETEGFTTVDLETETAVEELMTTTELLEREPDEEATPPPLWLRLRLLVTTFAEAVRDLVVCPPDVPATDVPATAGDFEIDPDDDPTAPAELLGDAAAGDTGTDPEPEKDCPGAGTMYM